MITITLSFDEIFRSKNVKLAERNFSRSEILSKLPYRIFKWRRAVRSSSTYATRLILRLACRTCIRPSQGRVVRKSFTAASLLRQRVLLRQLQRYLKELTDEFKSTESNRSLGRTEDFEKRERNLSEDLS